MPFNGLEIRRPLWKDGETPKTRRKKRRRHNDEKERAEKQVVRNRDERCRFPRCGCMRPKVNPLKAVLTVSHDFHKGQGGNPTGEVSIAPLMIAFCKWRHQDAPVSRHAGTMRTRYLTPDHNDGPVAFDIDMRALNPGQFQGKDAIWFEVARERYSDLADDAPRIELDDLTEEQEAILEELAEMVR